jgi:hypothetical protein
MEVLKRWKTRWTRWSILDFVLIAFIEIPAHFQNVREEEHTVKNMNVCSCLLYNLYMSSEIKIGIK